MTTRYTTAPASIDAPDAFHQGVVGTFFGHDLRKVHIRVGWLAAWEDRCARAHHMNWKRIPADTVLAPGVESPQKPRNFGQEAPSGVEAGQGQGQEAEAGWRAYKTATPDASFEERIHALAQALADPGFRTRLAGTLIDKHNDYGRSGVRPPELAPHISAPDGILVRESDKLARLRQLQQRGYTPKVAESIEDTAFDLVGYAALLYLAIQDEQQRAANDWEPNLDAIRILGGTP